MAKNSCSCAGSSRRYGALSSLGFRGASACCDNCSACSDCNSCTTCSGSPLYYTGRCPSAPNGCGCGNSCGGCGCSGCTGCSGNCGCGRSGSCGNSRACGQCENCGRPWNECTCGRNRCEDQAASSGAYGVFTALCPLNVGCAGAIPLEFDSGDTSCFRMAGSGVTIMRPGVYSAEFAVSIPAHSPASAIISLAVDGEVIFHSSTPLDACAANHNLRYTARGTFTIRRGQVVTLVTDSPINIPLIPGAFPAVQMTITRIG